MGASDCEEIVLKGVEGEARACFLPGSGEVEWRRGEMEKGREVEIIETKSGISSWQQFGNK